MREQPKPGPAPRSQKAPRSSDTATPHSTGTPAAALDLKPGARPVAEFELLHRLGRGGYGEVWKATGPGAVEQRSLDLMKNLRHAHLVGCSGAWQRDGFLVLALELADSSLRDRLSRVLQQGLPGIPRDELLEYMREAAKGLDYPNRHDVQHRDVKPENLLVVGGSVKVADFGLAKLVSQTMASHTGPMTWRYAPPEFFSGQTHSQSDQYSLAVTYCRLRAERYPCDVEHP